MKTFGEYLAEAKINESDDGELKIYLSYGKSGDINIKFPTNMINRYTIGVKYDAEILDDKESHKEFANKLDIISKKYDKEFKDFFKRFTLELEKETRKAIK